MMRKDQHLVMVVVDELGNALGVLTLPYLVRHALGAETNPLSDRVTKGRARIKRDEASGMFILDASTPLVVVNEELGLELPTFQSSTLAGDLVYEFGQLPSKGAKHIFDGYEFKIAKVSNKKIEKVSIKKI